jgi:RNA polymerase sigma-70 factor (ECF subfamily)
VAGTGADLEAALLRRVARGEEAALASLYDRLAPLAYGLSLRVTRDPRLAQDAVQEAFVRVWSRAARFDSRRGSPRAWVLHIARNAAIDQLRSERARLRTERRAGREPLQPEGEEARRPDAELAASRRGFLLRSALDKLPTAQRRMLEIAYFEGLSHSEIAAREGIPLGTVKTRIRDGVTRLRRMALEGKLDG